jgi:phage terminase small subunit
VSRKLTPKQERFVEEYLIDGNGAQAAIRAGYSAKDARTQASRFLSTNVNIKAAIAAGQRTTSDKLDITKDRVLSELAAIAFSDPAGLYGPDGNLLAIKDMPENVRRAIASVKVNRQKSSSEGETLTEEHTVEIRHWPKVDALEKLARHLGLFKEDNRVTIRLEVAEEIVDAAPGSTKDHPAA